MTPADPRHVRGGIPPRDALREIETRLAYHVGMVALYGGTTAVWLAALYYFGIR